MDNELMVGQEVRLIEDYAGFLKDSVGVIQKMVSDSLLGEMVLVRTDFPSTIGSFWLLCWPSVLTAVLHGACEDCVYSESPSEEYPCSKCSAYGFADLFAPTVSEPESKTEPGIVTRQEMADLIKELQEEEFELWSTKNDDYAERDGGNSLENFDQVAADMDMPARKAIWTYLFKHIRAIRAYCLFGKLESVEGLRGRLLDVRNYMAILAADARRNGDL